MKICLISFDYWGYDEKIVQKLIEMEHEAFHIKISDFKYNYINRTQKVLNFVKKNLFKKNIKKIKTEEFILSKLENAGPQDIIIVINPERISKSCHLKIKGFAKKYISYLYDSLDRYDNKNIISKNIFNKIFTFDKMDAENYSLHFLPNYIHLEKNKKKTQPNYKILSISSIDERYTTIKTIVELLDKKQIKHQTIFFGKRKPKNFKTSAVFTKEKLSQNQIQEKTEDAEILLDVLRENQNGLSFRFFDALALDKKIITTNISVTEYDFYNPNNILVIDKNKIEIPDSFLKTEYQKIPEDIYNKYTLKNWINKLIE
ncbi:hypothetical protein ACSV4D_04120 [Flavobacterium sp. ARAG 55.4]|uniref:hypothetical protein n=1 Tax=Flavobacterium sp. ARAG 55.4 TaxID=3451357 RepID=UPI003F45C014